MKAVAIRIEAFMDEMKADVLSVNPVREEAAILRLAIEETEAQAAADIDMQEVLAEPAPSPVRLHEAEVSLARHENAISRTRTMLGSLLRNGIRPHLRVHV